MKRSVLTIFTFIVAFTFTKTGTAQIQNEKNFSIWIPEKWSKNIYYEGADKVFDYLSVDEVVAVQIRVFDAEPAVSSAMIAEIYEQNMLPEGTYRELLCEYITTTGIPGLQGVYQYYYEGVKIAQSNFYTVQNGKGYVVSAIIPKIKLAEKSREVKRITTTFRIAGVGNNSTNSGHGTFVLVNEKTEFVIDKITLTDKIDDNNNAMYQKSVFNTTRRKYLQ